MNLSLGRTGLLGPISLIYIFLPYFLFFFGWLKLYLAIPASILLVIALFLAIRGRRDGGEISQDRVDMPAWWHVALILAIIVLWVGLTGAGGYGFQNRDYQRHNGMLKDLVERPWPTAYETSEADGGVGYLAYNLGFWLPAAGAR